MAIIMKRNKLKKISFGIFLFATIFIGLCSTSIAVGTNYQVALNKGTETFLVNKYNERKWELTVDKDLDPDDFFGGDSDDIGAKSRITIRNVDEYKWDLFDALISIFKIDSYIPEDLPISNISLLLLTYLSKDYVEEIYSKKYEVWEAITVKWDFETGVFDETPDEPENIMPIFKNPKDYKDLLDDYNDWALTVNSTMVLLGIEPFPIIDGEDFLWALITSELFTIASPFNSYLTAMIDELDCKHVEAKGNTLIIERKGVKEYNVEVTFNNQGIQSSIIIEDKDGRILYEIIQDNTDTIVLVVMGVIGASVAGVIIVVIRIKKKLKR
jgi:hypothetical protein